MSAFADGDSYYPAVPRNVVSEGPYGGDLDSIERPPDLFPYAADQVLGCDP